MERASAASHLANAPHDGPDEPLLLRHDPPDGMRFPPQASVGLMLLVLLGETCFVSVFLCERNTITICMVL